MAAMARSKVARGRLDLAGQRLGLRQPERAQQERALLAGQAVVGQVAVHQPALVGEPLRRWRRWSPASAGHPRAGTR